MRITAFLLGVLMLWFGAGSAAAAPATIPTGTVITKANWQPYQGFMSNVLQHMFMSNSPTTAVPPRLRIEVGPTRSYPLPASYWSATEKYAGQARLLKSPTGGYALANYVAGQPFPFDKLDLEHDPLVAYKLMYDTYYQYVPAIYMVRYPQQFIIDRYGNRSDHTGVVVDFSLMHNTDPGYPMTIPNSPGEQGVYMTSYSQLLLPIQNQYLTSLEVDFDNPERFPATYAFIPSLRRVLRLSTNSRCAPVVPNADFNYDDHSRIPLPPTWFSATFLGLKKELEFVVAPDKLSAAEEPANWYFSRGPVFPKARALGPWQMRDVYLISFSRLPQFNADYCEAQNIRYVDREQVQTLAWDDFDQNNKFWRGQFGFMPAVPHPSNPADSYTFVTTDFAHDQADFQQNHITVGLPPRNWQKNFVVDGQVPRRFRSVARFTTPAGLQSVLQ